MQQYSRQSPSPRYSELLAFYTQLHEEGDAARGIDPADMFAGKSLPPQAAKIKTMIDRIGARSLLDYGCGKARLYEISPMIDVEGIAHETIQSYWNLERIERFDPAYKPFQKLPEEAVDIVICTDVLEHCPESDMIWIIREMFSLARRGVFLNVGCYPASKTLPNGENAHCTIRMPNWWQGLIRYSCHFFPQLQVECWLDVIENGAKQSILITNET